MAVAAFVCSVLGLWTVVISAIEVVITIVIVLVFVSAFQHLGSGA